MKKTNLFKYLSIAIGAILTIVFLPASAISRQCPDSIFVVRGTVPALADIPAARLSVSDTTVTKQTGAQFGATLMFGALPVKNVSINVVDRPSVYVSGLPFGVKLYTKGVLVVGFSDVDTVSGNANPAKSAGMKEGDILLSINGTEITGNRQLASILEESGGKPMKVEILRGGKPMSLVVTPVKSKSEDRYKSGIWIRDSAAGIGTLTFYTKPGGYYAGLGHAIADSQTGENFLVGTGEVSGAQIDGLVKGLPGTPGELTGSLTSSTWGTVAINSNQGLYGSLLEGVDPGGMLMPVAMRQEITEGPAKIYCTINGTTPQYYDISIEKINLIGSGEKNMVIKVTDPDLLAKTGGIVQGMSGSPIIQNGRLIGAVTHVFVNVPDSGYAIFADTMVQKAYGLSASQSGLQMAG